jgi:tetratricopeptide (TPR) repeat protein
MLNRFISVVLLATLVWPVAADASRKPDAAAFLERIPDIVDQDVIILDGVVRTSKDVTQWDVIVNDSDVASLIPEHSADLLPIRVAIALRSGNNVVSLQARFANGRSKRWTSSVLRKPPAEGQRYALLLEGQFGGTSEVETLESVNLTLEQSGIPKEHIRTISRYGDLKSQLASISKQATNNDRFLVYFLGRSTPFSATGEPILRFESDSPSENDGILFSDLVRQVEGYDLPSLSFMVDTTSESPDNQNSSQRRNFPNISILANAERMGAPWLQPGIVPPNVEIAISNVLTQAPTVAPGDFTRSFLSALKAPIVSASPCTALFDVLTAMSAQSAERQSSNKPSPLYFSQRPDDTAGGFCFRPEYTHATSVSVSADAVPSGFRPHSAALVSAEIPSTIGAKWAEILVDDVLVRHVPVSPDASKPRPFKEERIPISPGTHLIQVRAGAMTNVLASGTRQLVVPKEKGPAPSFLSGGTLNATILEPEKSDVVTTDAVVNLDFVVEDKDKGAVQFEVRNNGVVVFRGRSLRLRQGQKLEVVHRVLLSPGINNIAVELAREGYYSQARISVVRQSGQSLRAVLIGPGNYQLLPYTAHAGTDVESMKKFLLRYTDITPQNITILTGAAATRDAITQAISSSTSTTIFDPFPYGSVGDETLFLYFSGLGTTVTDGTNSMRCILPYDADPVHLLNTCISTSEIDRLLDSWKRSIVMFDTSYDGLSGDQPPSAESHTLASRTYAGYLSSDPSWRLSAGTDRNNRVFVVASVANSASLEDPVTGAGLFTSAFIDSVKKQLADALASDPKSHPQLTLTDAYAGARNATADITGKRQIPVIKGVLEYPFWFSEESSSDLKGRISATLLRTERDVESLRSLDSIQLRRADELARKVLEIDPGDQQSQYSLAEIKLFEGDNEGALTLINKALQEMSGSTDASESASRALWLTLRAQTNLSAGDLSGAIADCEESVRTSSKSLKAAYLLGELYAANLQYDKSLKILNGVADRFGTMSGVDNLSDEEWGRAMVWIYIGLRRTDATSNPDARLKNYAASNPESGLLFRVLLANKLTKALFGHSDRPDLTLNLDLQETWSHLVVDYLLAPKEFVNDLRSFRERNLLFDPKDQKSFDCMIHFYLGINAIFEGANDIARGEFRSVVDTGQVQFPEYWTAKGELAKLE